MVALLRRASLQAPVLDRLKITYRPYLCPFAPLLAEVSEGAGVCDIGCGSGQFALLLARFARPSHILGLEVTPRLVRHARALLADSAPGVSAQFELFDGKNLPTSLIAADIVFMVDVLHHIPRSSQASFVAELFRRMRPGARLVLKDIDAAHPLVICNKIHDLLLSREIGRELSFAAASSLLRQNGFALLRTTRQRRLWYPHYTLVAEK